MKVTRAYKLKIYGNKTKVDTIRYTANRFNLYVNYFAPRLLFNGLKTISTNGMGQLANQSQYKARCIIKSLLEASKETGNKIKLSKLGKKASLETRKKMSLAQSGDKGNKWKGGITHLYLQIRHHFKSRQWVSDVFHRDDFTCQECFERGGKLNCHHIKHFSEIIKENKIKTLEEALDCEELWNLNNGVTLCYNCHKTKHKKNV